MTTGVIKGIGLVTTVIGLGASLVGSWVEDKKMDQKIEAKFNERLALTLEETEDESL